MILCEGKSSLYTEFKAHRQPPANTSSKFPTDGSYQVVRAGVCKTEQFLLFLFRVSQVDMG